MFTAFLVADPLLACTCGSPTSRPAVPLPAHLQTPWDLTPSRCRARRDVPASRSVALGAPRPSAVSAAARGTAPHFALQVMETCPDLAEALAATTFP